MWCTLKVKMTCTHRVHIALFSFPGIFEEKMLNVMYRDTSIILLILFIYIKSYKNLRRNFEIQAFWKNKIELIALEKRIKLYNTVIIFLSILLPGLFLFSRTVYNRSSAIKMPPVTSVIFYGKLSFHIIQLCGKVTCYIPFIRSFVHALNAPSHFRHMWFKHVHVITSDKNVSSKMKDVFIFRERGRVVAFYEGK